MKTTLVSVPTVRRLPTPTPLEASTSEVRCRACGRSFSGKNKWSLLGDHLSEFACNVHAHLSEDLTLAEVDAVFRDGDGVNLVL